jgi:hypothetical protein
VRDSQPEEIFEHWSPLVHKGLWPAVKVLRGDGRDPKDGDNETINLRAEDATEVPESSNMLP